MLSVNRCVNILYHAALWSPKAHNEFGFLESGKHQVEFEHAAFIFKVMPQITELLSQNY